MQMLSRHWFQVQDTLFPYLQEEIGPMGLNHQRLVNIIEFSNVIPFVSNVYHCRTGGRPCNERVEIAIAFLGKHVFNLPTTRALVDRLHHDEVLRRLCRWERKSHIPSESKFSRVFKEFSRMNIMEALFDRVVAHYHEDRIIGHIRRDSTEIDAREKAAKKPKPVDEKIKVSPPKRGRPKKARYGRLAIKNPGAWKSNLPNPLKRCWLTCQPSVILAQKLTARDIRSVGRDINCTLIQLMVTSRLALS